eukprot:605011-Amphidinium_carterae.1
MGGKRRQETLTPWTPKMARQVALSMSAGMASPPPGLASAAPTVSLATDTEHPGAVPSVGLPSLGLATDTVHSGALRPSAVAPPPGLAQRGVASRQSSSVAPPPGLVADSSHSGAVAPSPGSALRPALQVRAAPESRDDVPVLLQRSRGSMALARQVANDPQLRQTAIQQLEEGFLAKSSVKAKTSKRRQAEELAGLFLSPGQPLYPLDPTVIIGTAAALKAA